MDYNSEYSGNYGIYLAKYRQLEAKSNRDGHASFPTFFKRRESGKLLPSGFCVN